MTSEWPRSDTELLSDFFGGIESVPQFSKRKSNIPGDLRIVWRLNVLCLILERGRSNKLALEHLHVLWWAIRTGRNRNLFLRWLSGERRPDELLVRFDPSLSVTVDFALGQGLVELTSSRAIKLTVSGLAYAQVANETTQALEVERAFLEELPTNITGRQLQSLLEWR